MARVTAYEASDKTLHRDRKAWYQHEANLIAVKKIAATVEAEVARRANVSGQSPAEVVFKGEGVSSFIIENIEQFREILSATFKPGADDEHGEDSAEDQASAPAAQDAGADGNAEI